MKKVYVYPDRRYSVNPDTNPYCANLCYGLESAGAEIIRSKTAWLGTLDFFLYFFRMDIVVLNWAEEVANRTLGLLQTVGLVMILPLFKLFRVKIVWTIHNKTGHNRRNEKISNVMKKLLLHFSDVIVTHAKDGTTMFENSNKEILFFPHPFDIKYPDEAIIESTDIDILIWGKIQPYKGVLEFLEYLHSNNLQERFSIHIVGECPDINYLSKIQKLVSKTIEVDNRYLSDDNLAVLMQSSSVVLFTHKQGSVLSSGALIDSLAYSKTVVGPQFGNFRDFQDLGLIYTYNNFDELIDLVDRLLIGSLSMIDKSAIRAVLEKYSWERYGEYLLLKSSLK